MPKISIDSWSCEGGGAPCYLLIKRWQPGAVEYFWFGTPDCGASHTDTHETYFDAYIERRARCVSATSS